MTYFGFVKVPSSIPKREPVMLVHGEQRIVFNAIRDNGNGFDLLMEYEPYSLVAEGLELSEEAKTLLQQDEKLE